MTPAISRPMITSPTKTVNCDGGKGAAGHPRIYMTIGSRGWVECPYCSKRFEWDSAANVTADH